MITIPKRIDLIKMLPPKAVMAEVGVWRGYFSIEILNHADIGKLFLIDSWENFDAEHNEESMKECLHTLRGFLPYGQVEIIRKRSLDAAKSFADGFLDAAYIDASHAYQDVLDDLRAWGRVLKEDGSLMGHDYSDGAQAREWKIEVIPAVTQFCKETDWRLTHLTEDTDVLPSFALHRI